MASFTDEALARRLAREDHDAATARRVAQEQSDAAFARRLAHQDQQQVQQQRRQQHIQQHIPRQPVATVTGVTVQQPPPAAVTGVAVGSAPATAGASATSSDQVQAAQAQAAYGSHYPGARQVPAAAAAANQGTGMVKVSCHLCTSDLECAANVSTFRCGVCRALNHRVASTEASAAATQAALRAQYQSVGTGAWHARTQQVPCPCCGTFIHIPTAANAFVCGQCRNYIARPAGGLWAVGTAPYRGGLYGRGYCGRGYGYGRYGYGNGMLIGLTGAMFLTPWMWWPFFW